LSRNKYLGNLIASSQRWFRILSEHEGVTWTYYDMWFETFLYSYMDGTISSLPDSLA